MDGIVFFRQITGYAHHFQTTHANTLALKSINDFADETTLDTIGLDQHECSLHFSSFQSLFADIVPRLTLLRQALKWPKLHVSVGPNLHVYKYIFI